MEKYLLIIISVVLLTSCESRQIGTKVQDKNSQNQALHSDSVKTGQAGDQHSGSDIKAPTFDTSSSQASEDMSKRKEPGDSNLDQLLSDSEKLDTLARNVEIIVNSTLRQELLNTYVATSLATIFSNAQKSGLNSYVYTDMNKLAEYFRENLIKGEHNSFDEKMGSLKKILLSNDRSIGSCAGDFVKGHLPSGVYYIGDGTHQVYCDQETDGGGWTVVLRRQDGSEDFNRTWQEFKQGFGNLSSEFWIGNDFLHILTSSKAHEMRVDLEDFDGNAVNATYSTFRVEGEENCYRLHARGYSGNAGDGLEVRNYYSNNRQCFTTRDNDRDNYRDNCAVLYAGAWWWNRCGSANLNGPYFNYKQDSRQSLSWYYWGHRHGNIRKAEMKIRPKM